MSEQDERPSVDDPRIAEALERLEGLADKPPAEPVEVYEDVHRVLQETLAEAQRDSGQSGGPGGARP
ncbi:MAG TPA: hypothetical protein VF227_03980 [Actinomycetes bacterium]